MPVLKFNQCDYSCDGKRDKRGGFRVYCQRVEKQCVPNNIPGEVNLSLVAKLNQLERKLEKISEAQEHAQQTDMPGTLVTGRSGIPLSRQKKLDRQLDRTIELAQKYIQTKSAIDEIKSKIAAQKKKPQQQEKEKRIMDLLEKQFQEIEVGDFVDVGGNVPIQVAKKNPRTIVSPGGVKYTAKEIYKVIKKVREG